jgi:hypothetical protein
VSVLYFRTLDHPPDKISSFLRNFVGTSGGFEDGIANLDIGEDEEDGPATRLKGMKYMYQLVRLVFQHAKHS